MTVLGEQWSETITIFRCLAPAAFVGTFNVAEGWVYQSLASTDRMFRWGIIYGIGNVLAIVSSVGGGIVKVAIACSLYLVLSKVVSVIYCYHGTPLRVRDLIRTIYRPAIAAIGAAIVILLVQYWSLVKIQVSIDLLIYAVVYGACYILIWLCLPGGRATLLNLIKIANN